MPSRKIASMPDDKILHEIVDLIILSLIFKNESEDAYENYVNSLHNRFYVKNPEAFRARIIKGYKSLLEGITKSE